MGNSQTEQQLLDGFPVGIATLFPDGRFRSVNRKYCELLGYSEAQLLQMNHQQMAANSDKAESAAQFQAVLQRDSGSVLDKRCIRSNGTMVYCASRLQCIRDQTGQVMWVNEVLQDVSRHKLIEETLRSEKAGLQAELQDAKHLLQEVVQANRVALERIGEQLRQLEVNQSGEKRQSSADAVSVAMVELLANSKYWQEYVQLKTEKNGLQHNPFLLHKLIDEIVRAKRPLAEAREVEFIVEGTNGLTAMVSSDADLLRNLLVHLLDNAIAVTEKGSVKLGVRVEGEDARAIRVRFAVTDMGPGIPTLKQADLFSLQPLSDAVAGKQRNGEKLRLAVCKRLVELLGGEIGVVSEKRIGATLWVELTLGKAEVPGKSESRQAAAQDRLIMVVDNSQLNRQVTMRQLEQLGYRVRGAASGEAAIEASRKEHLSLILMECNMPGADGLETTREIRQLEVGENRPAVPIIGMTDCSSKQEQESCKAAGMNGYLCKPFQLDELQAMIRGLLKL